jgi:Family of unknown function (DUF6267)
MLTEGGNVFKNSDGQPATQRINQADVPATIAFVEKVLGMKFPQERWLGSTGRKPTSGDLDLGVDLGEVNKDQVAAKLTQWATSQNLDPREWVKKAGEVHFKTPIAGNPKKGYVQTDFMFFPNLDWGTFFYGGAEGSAFKGMNRNVLMSSIAKQLGLKVGANGMLSRTTNQLVQGGQDPDYVAQTLLGQGATRDNLKNVESIYAALANDPNRDAKLADFRDYLSREGIQEPAAQVQENEVSFMARLRDRIVNQGYHVIIEAEAPVKKKDPRIPHPEDAFFMGGSAAAAKAIQDLQGAIANASKTTIKWDGKPALIWGRLPNGRLAVMDKYMFDAKYPAQSPEDWVKYDQQKKSGNLRSDLYPKLKALWPGLDAATVGPGFYWGDLMWAGELQPQGGNYVFKPNLVQYSVPANSELGKTIPGKTGGIVVHQQFANLGDQKAQPWNGKGLQNVPGGVDIISPNVGITFKLTSPGELITAAKQAVSTYGAAVDEMLNSLPASTRAQMQTYFNQRIIGGTVLSMPNWMKTKSSARQYNELVTGNPDANGQYNAKTGNVPGKLYTLDANNKPVPSAAHLGLLAIWNSIYNLKLNLAQQLEQQVQGIGQSTGGQAEGEGFVVPTPTGLVKLVNRGVFSAGNAAQNNPK